MKVYFLRSLTIENQKYKLCFYIHNPFAYSECILYLLIPNDLSIKNLSNEDLLAYNVSRYLARQLYSIIDL